MIVAFIEKQEEELPRPEVIEHEGKQLQRLPERRVRPYVSAFGPTPFRRYVYAARETQRPGGGAVDALRRTPGSAHGQQRHQADSARAGGGAEELLPRIYSPPLCLVLRLQRKVGLSHETTG